MIPLLLFLEHQNFHDSLRLTWRNASRDATLSFDTTIQLLSSFFLKRLYFWAFSHLILVYIILYPPYQQLVWYLFRFWLHNLFYNPSANESFSQSVTGPPIELLGQLSKKYNWFGEAIEAKLYKTFPNISRTMYVQNEQCSSNILHCRYVVEQIFFTKGYCLSSWPAHCRYSV